MADPNAVLMEAYGGAYDRNGRFSMATGLPAECAHGSIRFSLGRENTMEDIVYLLDVLPKVIRRIRGMSTAYARRQ